MRRRYRTAGAARTRGKGRIRQAVAVAAAAAVAVPTVAVTPAHAATALPGNAGFNYGEALQKSVLFYEAQRSGSLSTAAIPTRFAWRGDSQLADGKAQGVDLSGGWVDAGDNVKYGFPMAGALTMLAWSGVEYRQAFADSGQLPWLRNQLRWANDYLLKAHTAPNELWGQVGLTNSDHSKWASIEVSHVLTNRPAYKITPTCPGSDLAAETAAAMASSSMVFRPTDPAYADTLLTHAEQLYRFADTYRGKYTNCIKDAQGPYNSYSGFQDELVWGALWLHLAKESQALGSGTSYLDKATAEYPKLGLEGRTGLRKYKWTHGWDDKTFGSYVLMARLKPGDPQYRQDAERWLDYWTVGFNGQRVPYTPGGHARLDNWGSFRYAANTAFIGFVYSDWLTDPVKKARYREFGEQQVNYIVGQNPRGGSYIVGFGANSPQHPHHRTAHGSWSQEMGVPAQHRHVLYGALVGSPTTDDSFNDSISDYQANEVALDYNAGLVGALAKMYSTYGGAPLADNSFPLADTPHSCKDEYAIFLDVYSNNSSGLSVSASLENRSAWPARVSEQLKFRYYFTLDTADPGDIAVSLGSAPAGTKISAPTAYDAARKIYYVTVDATGTKIFPGYAYGLAGPEIRFSITSRSSLWNPANDWSARLDTTYTGGYGGHDHAPNVPVYEGAGTRLCGEEPA